MWLPDFFYSKTFKIITTVIISVNLMIIITLKIVDLYCDEPGCWNKKDWGTNYCMTKSYPSYLTSRNNIVLGENALNILKLQSEGKSSADIAKELKISEATVKYHNKETYRKLGVRNKAAAITEARKRKLI